MIILTQLEDENGGLQTIKDDDAMRIDLGLGEGFRFMIHRTVSYDEDESLCLVVPPYTISDYDTSRRVCTEETGAQCIAEAKRLIQRYGVEKLKELLGAITENDVPLNDPLEYERYDDYYLHLKLMCECGVVSLWE